MLQRFVRLFQRCDEGSALIEATIVVPVLMTLAFGVYEFSWYFYQEQLISTGLRDAARYVARNASPGDTTCNPSIWPAAQNLATTGTIDGTGTSRVNGWTTSMVSLACEQPVAGLNVVNVKTDFAEPSLGFFVFLGLTAPSISVFHRERIIGQG